jgi:predicted ATPase
MVLAGPSINVQQVIELAGYLDFFAIYPSVHAALNALQARETLNLPGQTIKNRYYIEAKIGDGPLGTIFKATDTRLNRSVAIKILSASFSEGAIERFLQQARDVINLIHPNIVDIYDCDEDQGLSYMVEEFIEGQSLPHLFNIYSGQPLPLDLALTIAEKIARALEYAHAHGVIHGDLKPKNVLLADDIKISDFGLGRLESGKALLNKEDGPVDLVTARYLAPEQVLGHPIDARTDLYALGIILYELFTGQPLFEGSDQEVMEQHRSIRPRPPRELNPRLSRSLEHLILKLLDKDPNRRYVTARQVRRILTNMTLTVSHSPLSQAFGSHRWPALVNRQEPLQRLLELWAETRQGQGQLVLIAGEAGIGKTRLTQELADRVGEATLLFGRCRPPESSPAYQPFIEALKTYFATTPTPIAQKQVGQVLSEAGHFIPEIQQIMPNFILQHPSPEFRPPAFSLAEAIAQVAVECPWLIILDDLQWADPSSLRLLDYLARHCRQLPLMIVAAYRSDGGDQSSLPETLSLWSSYPACTSMVLGHLAEQEVKQLLEYIWQQAPPADLVGAIYRRTQGNPLFVEETAKSLVDEEVITWREGRWHFAPVVEAGLPQRLREATLRRVNRLNKETQTLLHQAAVLGYAFSFDDLHNISDLSEGNILESLDVALERQLIQDVPAEDVLRFKHSHTQQVLYDNSSLLKQRLIHREAGETLEQSHSLEAEHLAAELAYHFYRAGELEKSLAYSIQAAAQARAFYANLTALYWSTQALEALNQLSQDNLAQGQRFELLLAREQIYDALGERQAQAADLAALQTLAQALDDPAKQAVVHTRQAHYERVMNQLAPASTEAQVALIAARQAGNPLLEGESLIQLAYIVAGQGHVELAQAHMHDAQEFLEQAGVPQAEARSLNGLGDLYKLLKDYARAEKYYRHALALNQAGGDRYGEAVSLNNLASLLLEMGDSASAGMYCRQALEINRLLGHRQGETACLENLEKIEELTAASARQG